MNPVIIVILLSLVGVIGDFFIKLAGNEQKSLGTAWFILGLLTYASTAFGWFYVMKHIKLSSLGVIYALATSLLLIIIGVFYFHEKLNMQEVIGMTMAIISIILLSRFA